MGTGIFVFRYPSGTIPKLMRGSAGADRGAVVRQERC